MWRELESEAEHWGFIQAAGLQPGIFLQSPAWAKFQERLGSATKTLGYFQDNKIIGLVLLIKSQLPFQYFYWFAPKGPHFIADCSDVIKQEALLNLVNYLKSDKTIFLRIEPNISPAKSCKTKPVNPSATSVVDFKPAWESIIANMHEKTRYNMRLAERKGLKFRWANLAEFDNFWNLLQETAKRDNFRTHEFDHYKTMLELFGSVPLDTSEVACRLGLVEYNGKLLAANLVLVCNKQATYLHGASSREHHELMAPYLLHGEVMRQLKEAGCKSYDLWGVQPQDGSLKNWAGFTRFKVGWGGQYYEAPGTFDYPIKKILYLVYRLARNLR